MKKLFITLSVLATTLVWAQKKEVANAVKAIESGDITTANKEIAAVDSQINGKTYLLEPSVLEEYYYAKGLSLLKSGKSMEGATYLAKINELGKSKIYTGKDASRNKVYFVGKTAADASGISGLKEETYQLTKLGKLSAIIDPILQKTNQSALDSYNAKNYQKAGDEFTEVYNLLKAAGNDNQQYLYNAALSYFSAENYPKAIETYKTLIEGGYTGVKTTYTAKNKTTGETETFSDKTTWELSKKDANYADFKTETSKSIAQDLYVALAELQINTEKYDDALATIDEGIKKYPNNTRLAELQGTAFYRSGKTNEFVANLKSQIAKNPNDATNWYNLGVLQSKDPATVEESINSFKKALEIKPNMKEALQNITYTIMGDDAKTIDNYQTLRKAGKIDEANKVIEERRSRFAKALPYAEKWYEIDSQNIDAVSLLKGLYQTTKNDAKAKEFQAKEEALKK